VGVVPACDMRLESRTLVCAWEGWQERLRKVQSRWVVLHGRTGGGGGGGGGGRGAFICSVGGGGVGGGGGGGVGGGGGGGASGARDRRAFT